MSSDLSIIAIFFLIFGLVAVLIISRIIWRRCCGTVSEPARRGWIRIVESMFMAPYAMLARAEVVLNQEQQHPVDAQSWVDVSPTPMAVNDEYNFVEDEPQHLIVHFDHSAPSTPTVVEASSAVRWIHSTTDESHSTQLRSYTNSNTGNSGTSVPIAHQVLQ